MKHSSRHTPQSLVLSALIAVTVVTLAGSVVAHEGSAMLGAAVPGMAPMITTTRAVPYKCPKAGCKKPGYSSKSSSSKAKPGPVCRGPENVKVPCTSYLCSVGPCGSR